MILDDFPNISRNTAIEIFAASRLYIGMDSICP